MNWLRRWLTRREIARGILDDDDAQTMADLERREREHLRQRQDEAQQRIHRLEILVEAQRRHGP